MVAAACLGVGGGEAQESVGRADVRALELMVAVEARSGFLRRTSPAVFSPADFELLRGGERVSVLGVDASIDEAAQQPWQILIYVEAALSSSDLVRLATGLLADSAGRLTELGEVEVVMADPTPRLLLAPSRDERQLGDTLAGLSLQPRGNDRLVALRSEVLDETDVDDDLTKVALASEIDAIERQSDRLLMWLSRTRGVSARKVLFLISGGFDLDPGAFYRTLSVGPETAGPSGLTLGSLPEELPRAVAADGWIAFALRQPVPDPLPRRWGLRRSLLVRVDGNWDPQRAEAYFELGESLIRQQKWRRAEEALRSAAYHFYSQPKLRSRQGQALLRLSYVLEQQGRDVEADKTARKAVELDASLASQVDLAGLLDPLQPLAMLAEASSGGFIADAEGMKEVLSGLSHRLRLEYQVDAVGADDPMALSVSYAGRHFEVLAPRWSREGTPPITARARARLLLDDGLHLAQEEERLLSSEGLHADCSISARPAEDGSPVAAVRVAVDPYLGEAWSGLSTRMRLTVSSWVARSARTVQRLGAEEIWKPGQEFLLGAELPVSTIEPQVALVIEEMTTERWFATLLECSGPESSE